MLTLCGHFSQGLFSMYSSVDETAPLPYAAAVLDGDGSIILESSGKQGRFKPVLRVEMKDHTIPSWLRKNLPTGQSALVRNLSQQSGTMGIWRTGRRDLVLEYLIALEPYLIEKRHRALRLIQWIQSGEKDRRAYYRDIHRVAEDVRAPLDVRIKPSKINDEGVVGGGSVSGRAAVRRVLSWSRAEQLSWLAGMIEAEGCIRLDGMSMHMNCWPVLAAVQAVSGGRLYPARSHDRAGKWKLGCRATAELLPELFPVMRGADKWNQGQIFMEYRAQGGDPAYFKEQITIFKHKRCATRVMG